MTQTILSYLYTPIIRMQILDGTVTNREERRVFNNTIQLYKGTDNPVQIKFLNQDQKKLDVTNYTFVAKVMEGQEGFSFLTPTITITDATNGKGTVTFTEEDLASLDAARYTLAIKGTKSSVEAPAYADDHYTLGITVHVNPGFLADKPS
jgi:hypothetical protein